MKVLVYMAVTPNGFIAKEDDDTGFVSKIEWSNFISMVNRIGNIVIGRRTFDIMQKGGELDKFDKVKVVVLSQKKFKTSNSDVSVVASPAEAVKVLSDFDEILVAGGGGTNGSFMKDGLVDEIYLDVEPVVFGKGIKLFGDCVFEAKLELIDTKLFSKNLIQLHYRVIK